MLYRLCLFLVRSLTSDPDAVLIDHIETEKVDIFFLRVGEDDRGRLLGKRGSTISALRAFLAGVSARLGREVVIELVD
ncbi:KH domain-containing protein [Candidatus Bipolaricaulota bacterium]|nr:KH domain-containing protein [Candidatus Bipolaricaulota bacterium]